MKQKKLTRLCLSLMMMLSAFMAFSVIGHAEEGFLQDAVGDTVDLFYGEGGDRYWGFGIEIQEGDQVSYKSLTPSTVKVNWQRIEGNFANANFKMLKKTNGKVQITAKRGGRTYTKTVTLKWHKKPIPTSFKLGGRDYTVVFENTDYFEIHKYLTGKIQVKAPSGWFVHPALNVEYGKNGKITSEDWYIGRKLPANCIRVNVNLINKSNPDLWYTCTLYSTRGNS